MKVAVAGLGWWGRQIIACLEKSPRFDVLYGVDPFPADDIEAFRPAHPFTLASDLFQVLADAAVESVVLATPHALHEEQALRVIAAGKNLFCEKPLTMTGAGAPRVAKACRGTGRVLGVGHERRFEPAFEELQSLVRAGALGRLLRSHDLFRKPAPSSWRLNSAHAPAGLMTALGVHLTDLFVHLAGPAEEVRARTSTMVLEPPAEDFMSAGIVFRSGVRASMRPCRSHPSTAGSPPTRRGLGGDRERGQCRPGQADDPDPRRCGRAAKPHLRGVPHGLAELRSLGRPIPWRGESPIGLPKANWWRTSGS